VLDCLPVDESDLVMAVIDSEKIDFVGHDPESDVVTLAMVEERAWDGSEERLLELEAKIQNYFSFIVDGQFARMYPAYVEKPIEMKLFSSSLPDEETRRFIERVRLTLAEHHIAFVVSKLK
jgi:hypothetical protein